MQLANRPGVYWSGRVFVSEIRFPRTIVFDFEQIKSFNGTRRLF